jgi:hypothetical protein
MFKPFVLPAAFLAGFVSLPAHAANVSISAGQADVYVAYKNENSGSFEGTLDYYNLGFSTRRGGYTFGLNVTGLLEDELKEVNVGEISFPDAERDSISFSIAKPISDTLSLSGGYYTSELAVHDLVGAADTIETQALFATLTFSDQLTDRLFWYGRLGAQINEAELTVHPGEDPVISETLDGFAYVVGAGIVYPLEGSKSLTFGTEYKEFNYDGGIWDLDEDQTLFTIGYNYGF